MRLFWMSPCKLNNHGGLQHSSVSLPLIISVLQFPTYSPFSGIQFFETRSPRYFRQSCLLTLHTGTTHISGEISSAESALSSGPLTRHLTPTLTNGSLRAEGVVECRHPRCWAVPSANRSPTGTSLIYVGSIRRALARSPSLLLHCQQLEKSLMSAGQLCHTRISFFGSKFVCSVSAGAGESGKQLHMNFILTSFVRASVFFLGRSFRHWLFCRNIRPGWERLLLYSPHSIKHSFFFSFHVIPLFSDMNQNTQISLQSFPLHCF